MKYRIITLVLLLCNCILAIMLFYNPYKSYGEQAVNLMYDFNSIDELNSNTEPLKDITDDESYNNLVVSNYTKALRTYLKLFRQKDGDVTASCDVEILREHQTKEGGYVLYTLHSNALSEGRKFLLLYDISDGKLSNVREMECIDFYGANSDYVTDKVDAED